MCRRSPRASTWTPRTCRASRSGWPAPACAGASTIRSATSWAWARAASRTPGCSGCGACCWAMPAATAGRAGHGIAATTSAAFQGIQPYGEVGGLDASIAGSLAAVVESLTRWWTTASTAGDPGAMGRAGARADRGVLRAHRRSRADDGGGAAGRAARLARSLRQRRLRRAGVAGGRARSLAGRHRRAGPEQALPRRRRHLLHPAADALDSLRGGLPAGDERRRLPAQQPAQRLRPDCACRASIARATGRGATTTGS